MYLNSKGCGQYKTLVNLAWYDCFIRVFCANTHWLYVPTILALYGIYHIDSKFANALSCLFYQTTIVINIVLMYILTNPEMQRLFYTTLQSVLSFHPLHSSQTGQTYCDSLSPVCMILPLAMPLC